MYFCRLLILLLISSSFTRGSPVCATPRRLIPEPRVLDPEIVGENRFSYMCSIQKLTGDHLCGGVLIDPFHMLTAAHCFKLSGEPQYTEEDITIRCGIYLRTDTDEEKTFQAEHICMHGNWDGHVENGSDIAVVKLNRAAKGPFPFYNDKMADYTECHTFDVIGFGLNKTNGDLAVELAASTGVPFFSQERCNATYHFRGNVTDSLMCAGNGLKGACDGDSGGGLFITDAAYSEKLERGLPGLDLLVAIVSFGYPGSTCDMRAPGVYTRVAFYLDWIRDTLENDQCSGPDDPPSKNVSDLKPPSTHPPAVTTPEVSVPPEYSPPNLDNCETLFEELDSLSAESAPRSAPAMDESNPRPHYCEYTEFHLQCLDPIDLDGADLMKALEEDEPTIVQGFLCEGLEANAEVGLSRYPPLIVAARLDAVESTKVLLQNDIDIDIVDQNGLTAISHAVVENSIETLKVLIVCGADVNKDANLGNTPLHLAAAYGNLEATKILLQAGASTLNENKSDEEPSDLICFFSPDCPVDITLELECLLS